MDPPSPSKKPNTSRTSSIYASLNKINLFKSSPPRESQTSGHTRAISLPYALASKSAYRPDSTQDFLHRLATFKLSSYNDKPPELNPVAAAKSGWANEGKERLLCSYCGASWAIASSQGLSKDAAETLLRRQCAGLVSNHKEFCPWKKAQCDGKSVRFCSHSFLVPLQNHASGTRRWEIASLTPLPFFSPPIQTRSIGSPSKVRPSSLAR